MKKWIAILLCAVAVLGAGGGIGLAIYSNQPQNVLLGAVTGAVEDLLERPEIEPLYDMLSGGSLAFETNKIERDGVNLISGSHLSGKLFFSPRAVMLDDLDITYKGTHLMGEIYLSDKLLYVSESEVLKGTYGGKRDELAEDFANSIFAFEATSDYAITDEALYESIYHALRMLDNGDLKKDAPRLARRVGKHLLEILYENFTFEMHPERIRLNGETVKARTVSVIADGIALANALYDIMDYLGEDEEIAEFLDEHLLAYCDMKGLSSEKTPAEHYRDYLAQLKPQVDEICRELTDSATKEIVVKVSTKRGSSKLLRMTVIVGENTVLHLDCGKDGIKNTNKITLRCQGEEYTFAVNESNRRSYRATLRYGDETLSVAVNKKSESYVLSHKDEGADTSLTVRGGLSKNGDKTAITIEWIAQSYVSFFDRKEVTLTTECDISLTLDQHARMPRHATEYERLSDIAE
ncbi:MAG: hypothetical protein IJY22_02010, partial [Clostridia bacterium]|nr:hypothetical protein [Clostridia bacterium]